jgi:hypothetical protein
LVLAGWAAGFALQLRPAVAMQEQAFEQRLERAIAALDSAEVERGMDLLRALLASADSAVPRGAIARAHLHLAAASLSLGLRDSASLHLREMVRANPFAVPDTLVFNPDLTALFRIARRTTPALGLRVARDTVLRPQTDKYLVAVAVGEPRQVRIALIGPGASPTVVLEETAQVDSSSTVPLTPVGGDSVPIPAGIYRLVLTAGGGLETTTLLRVTRVSVRVDTLLHEAPLDSARFRPETRKGPPAGWSALAGLAAGAVAAAIPLALSNPDLTAGGSDTRSISVAASIAAAGIVGVFVGRRPVSIPENIEYNRALRASWEERNREIARENERRRQWVPLRIEVLQP